jgi:hypothetical protein
MARGSTSFVLNLGPEPHNRLWVPTVASGHVLAVVGGRVLYDYTQSPVSPVAQRPEKQWADAVDRFLKRPFYMRPEWDLKLFHYMLLLTSQPGLAGAVKLAIKDQATFIASSGDWYLFESRLPGIPIDSDDVPLTAPAPPRIATLLKRVANELSSEQPTDSTNAVDKANPVPAIAPSLETPEQPAAAAAN